VVLYMVLFLVGRQMSGLWSELMVLTFILPLCAVGVCHYADYHSLRLVDDVRYKVWDSSL
jgi:hypothetical protein